MSTDSILGHAVFRYWPLSELGLQRWISQAPQPQLRMWIRAVWSFS
jgi:hypothetical protein